MKKLFVLPSGGFGASQEEGERVTRCIAFTLIIIAATAGFSQATNFDLSASDQVKTHNVVTSPADFNGRKSLEIRLTDDMQAKMLKGQPGDQATFVEVPVSFQNGTIEVDIAGEVNGKGAQDARGFVGIAFRINKDASKFEAIYLRMTNGLKADPPPPPPRNERAIQYFSYPDWRFSRFRKEFPGQYEKGANIGPKLWIPFRLEINGTTAKAYVNNEPEPALTVTDLKMGADARGSVGLWVDDGSDGYFSNLRITPMEKKANP